jgi:hypothetical protein
MQWVQESAGGCATSIAVAPNDVPWVIGCNGNADAGVYYLQYGGSDPTCKSLICDDKWIYDGAFAKNITTDYHGSAYVTNSNGELWSANWTEPKALGDRTPGIPNGTWMEHSPSYLGDPRNGPGGCVTAAVAGTDDNCGYEGFVTPMVGCLFPDDKYSVVLGCGRGSNNYLYEWVHGTPIYWAQLDAQHAATASQIAIFTQSSPTSPVPTLWTLDSTGQLASYNGVRFVPEPNASTVAWAITDHFVAAYQPSLPRHPGSSGIYQWNDDSQTWSYFIAATAPNGHTIMHIAYSGLFYSGFGPVGPSRLWAIDDIGNIYFAAPVHSGPT